MLETLLLARAQDFAKLMDVRSASTLIDHADRGDYTVEAKYLLACDGALSGCAERMDLTPESTARTGLLAADLTLLHLPADAAPEPWLWFDPGFDAGAFVRLIPLPAQNPQAETACASNGPGPARARPG